MFTVVVAVVKGGGSKVLNNWVGSCRRRHYLRGHSSKEEGLNVTPPKFKPWNLQTRQIFAFYQKETHCN